MHIKKSMDPQTLATNVAETTENIMPMASTEKIENLLHLDVLELNVGYDLLSLFESDQSGDMLERIVSIRKQFALDFGIIIPNIFICDNLRLQVGEYQLLLSGNKVAGAILMPDELLALDPTNTLPKIEGTPTKEPAFGLDAIWISKSQKEAAESSGYTVLDLPTTIATHITEIINQHMHEILGIQEASTLIDNFKTNSPKIVEELIPGILSLGTVTLVLQGLLREKVSIRDLRTILETLIHEGPKSKDVGVLIDSVRCKLFRSITAKYQSAEKTLMVLLLSPSIEELISKSLQQTEQGIQFIMDPRTAKSIITEIAKTIENTPDVATQPVILTSPRIRQYLRKLLEKFIPQVAVLSHNEVSLDVNIEPAAIVEVANAG